MTASTTHGTERLQLLPASEVAHILRLTLGQRQWRDFLADCIRERTPGIAGWLLLVPYASSKVSGKAARPLYRACDVRVFIEQARAADSSLRPCPVTARRYAVDTTIGIPWQMRRASRLSS
jgi:hypothetical protein